MSSENSVRADSKLRRKSGENEGLGASATAPSLVLGFSELRSDYSTSHYDDKHYQEHHHGSAKEILGDLSQEHGPGSESTKEVRNHGNDQNSGNGENQRYQDIELEPSSKTTVGRDCLL